MADLVEMMKGVFKKTGSSSAMTYSVIKNMMKDQEQVILDLEKQLAAAKRGYAEEKAAHAETRKTLRGTRRRLRWLAGQPRVREFLADATTAHSSGRGGGGDGGGGSGRAGGGGGIGGSHGGGVEDGDMEGHLHGVAAVLELASGQQAQIGAAWTRDHPTELPRPLRPGSHPRRR